jgi:Type IV secretion-system coupling protein DNA-binding domain
MIKLLVVVVLSVVIAPITSISSAKLIAVCLDMFGFSDLNSGNIVGELVGLATGSIAVLLIAKGADAMHDLEKPKRREGLLKEAFSWVLALLAEVVAVASVYHLSLFLTSDIRFSFLVAVFTAFMGLFSISRWKFPEYPFDPYVSGVKLKSAKTVRKERGKPLQGCLPWGADQIDIEDETKHILLFGNIGGGKTTFFKMLMSSVAFRPGVWIVTDPKNELVPELMATGRDILILNPLDRRSAAWDLCADFINDALALVLACAIVPKPDKVNDPHWIESAQNLVQGVIIVFIYLYITKGYRWEFRDILLACSDINDLRAILSMLPRNKPLLEYLKPTASEQNSYMSTLTTNLKRFQVVASLWHRATRKFSITEAMRNPDDSYLTIVLGIDYQERGAFDELNRIFMERLKDLALNLSESDSRRIRFFIDEVSMSSKLLGGILIELMSLVRSRGGSVVLGAQNWAALQERFGDKGASQIVGLCRFRAILGGVDENTAQYVSQGIGNVDYVEVKPSYSKKAHVASEASKEAKASDGSRDISIEYHRVSHPVVSPDKLTTGNVPRTCPENGLTGLFLGGASGLHWHTYDWATVKAMQIEPLEGVEKYSRISELDPAYILTPWSNAERAIIGLPPIDERGNSNER